MCVKNIHTALSHKSAFISCDKPYNNSTAGVVVTGGRESFETSAALFSKKILDLHTVVLTKLMLFSHIN